MGEEIKEPKEAEERKESKRAQGPLVKYKGEDGERTFEVRAILQLSTPKTAPCKLAVRGFWSFPAGVPLTDLASVTPLQSAVGPGFGHRNPQHLTVSASHSMSVYIHSQCGCQTRRKQI